MSVAGIPLRLVSKCLFVPLESGVVVSERSGPADGSVVGGMACRFETGEAFISRYCFCSLMGPRLLRR